MNGAAAARDVPPAELPSVTKVVAFATMCVGFFIALLDIQIVSASLRDIGGGLSAGADETAWVQTSYLIAEIIVIPLSGWLSRVMSTRWLFCASAAGFTGASLLCGWAWDIQSMIAFRALQGFLGGPMIPTVFTTAFIYFNGQQRVIAAATIGSIASLAPTLGPTVGGWITDNYSWHWLFFINLVPGIFVAVVVPMLVRIDGRTCRCCATPTISAWYCWRFVSAASSTPSRKGRAGTGSATTPFAPRPGSPASPESRFFGGA